MPHRPVQNTAGASILARPIRLAVLTSLIAHQWQVFFVFLLIPILCAVIDEEWGFAFRLTVTLIGLLICLTLARRLPLPTHIRRIEALATISVSLILSVAFFVWPLMIFDLSLENALFEAMSGVTTTGLTMIGDIEAWPWSAQFARSWLQWCGGLGMVVATLALVISPSITARRLSVIDLDSRDVVSSTRIHARHVLWVYVALSAACFLSLLAVLKNPLDAVIHMMGAVSTGGFSNRNDSLATLTPAAQTIIMGFTILCAISLAGYFEISKKPWARLLLDKELHWLLGIIGVFTILCVLSEGVARGVSVPIALTLLTDIVSAQTGTGFSTVPVNTLHQATVLILILAMFIGGDIGSTSGGIKIARFAILVMTLRVHMLRTQLSSRAILHVRRHSRRVHPEDVTAVMILIIAFIGLNFFSWSLFLAYGYAPLDSLFEVVSATATVGLSMGITDDQMPSTLKWLLILDMWLGRLEIFAVLILFWPGSWVKGRL